MEDRPQRVQRSLGDVLIGPLREGVGLGQGDQPSLVRQELCQKGHARSRAVITDRCTLVLSMQPTSDILYGKGVKGMVPTPEIVTATVDQDLWRMWHPAATLNGHECVV